MLFKWVPLSVGIISTPLLSWFLFNLGKKSPLKNPINILGFLFQRFTCKTPNDKHIYISLLAFHKLLNLENKDICDSKILYDNIDVAFKNEKIILK